MTQANVLPVFGPRGPWVRRSVAERSGVPAASATRGRPRKESPLPMTTPFCTTVEVGTSEANCMGGMTEAGARSPLYSHTSSNFIFTQCVTLSPLWIEGVL